MKKGLTEILNHRPLVFDGAMGTMLEAAGARSECNDALCLSSPEVVARVHRSYLDAGSDIITTNTFGASTITLADHGLADRCRDINLAAARIAREEAEKNKGEPRFVAGSIGPTSKLPTLGHVTFSELFSSYREQAGALLEGGVDLLLIETCQDPLQTKAAAAAVRCAMDDAGEKIPMVISVTIEPSGTMLLGTDLIAALASVAPYEPFAFGINCGSGPDMMEEYIKGLSDVSPFNIICQPNAGMPLNKDGRPFYPLSPEEFARTLADYTKRFGISLAGGCCGTTPEHIAALARELKHTRPAKRVRRPHFAMVSSLYTAVSLDQQPKPFIIAEQTNVNGSRKLREMLLKNDFDAMDEIAKSAAEASHALDICVAYAGRKEAEDLVELARRVALKADAPVMIDSTNPDSIERALEVIPGRAIINSINLEDGGKKAHRILELARRFGAAVVALTIDEEGMAKDCRKKLSVARRLAELACTFGLSSRDLLIDPLTFTLASGDASLRRAGIETLDAIRMIKSAIHGANVLLGVSNISFGLPPKARRMLSSVFLSRAIERGLDAAIINPTKIVPLDQIPSDVSGMCNRLIDGDFSSGDPLVDLINFANAGGVGVPEESHQQELSPVDALRAKVINGSREGLSSLVEEAVKLMPPARIINEVLLPAMHEVGIRFSKGRMPLPFVLQAAEVMRAAVDIITPLMAAGEKLARGTIVLATVRGDVHDIGKDLVDAILSNNGFKVINLGIRQPAAAIIESAKANAADAIGLSGLLVSSCEVMREDLEIFREAGLSVPVLCGGAALTSQFVDKELSKAYGAPVFYCADAFSGLEAMEKISGVSHGR